jgi:hypothetical protein
MFSPFRALATTLLLLLPYNPRCKRKFSISRGSLQHALLGLAVRRAAVACCRIAMAAAASGPRTRAASVR